MDEEETTEKPKKPTKTEINREKVKAARQLKLKVEKQERDRRKNSTHCFGVNYGGQRLMLPFEMMMRYRTGIAECPIDLETYNLLRVAFNSKNVERAKEAHTPIMTNQPLFHYEPLTNDEEQTLKWLYNCYPYFLETILFEFGGLPRIILDIYKYQYTQKARIRKQIESFVEIYNMERPGETIIIPINFIGKASLYINREPYVFTQVSSELLALIGSQVIPAYPYKKLA